MLIDIGSTYFKVSADNKISHHFRNFDKDIYDDLIFKCEDEIKKYKKEDIHICSSANGGLSTLIVGLTESFSLKYAGNIAYNSGINIIETVIYSKIDEAIIPTDIIDVIIIVGGIDSSKNVYDEKLINFIEKLTYSNIVFVGASTQTKFLNENIPNLKVLPNIIDNKLKMREDELKEYLTNLYQEDIMGKEDIKHLYSITSNQIYSTPYIVNKSLPLIHTKLEVVDPFIVIDIGGATTDIHYSKDLVEDNIITSNEYDRLVFKKLGVYKSRDSLVFSAKNNEFVYELLAHLNTTENMLDERCENATKLLMQLSIFLVLYKVSHQHKSYLNIKLNTLNSIVLTGGITKVLSEDEMNDIVSFFYKKILNFHISPQVVVDKDYAIWTLGMEK
ncbi:MAG: methylaspartate mutase [Epsilonproteobacteria bacterium]|nr:MAG: methylaspartate mutase [Campylobacterota bacterium]